MKGPLVYVCRKEYFNAAHKLYNDNWSREKNEELFGVCANENWHGHNFELIVTVKGVPHPETGCVIDLKTLGSIIKKEVITKIHHKNLNLDVDFLQGKMPSCEILVVEFWNLLESYLKIHFPKVLLHRIQLIETEKNFVEYYGEKAEDLELV